MSDSEQRVLSGQTWDEFCDALKQAGQLVQSPDSAKSAFDKAEGYRYLTRLLRAGLESFLEHGDADFPVLRCPVHTTIKIGADNPDNYYQTASINPEHDYLIKGTRGSVDYLGFGTVINRYGGGGTMETTGYLDSGEIEIDDEGYLEIVVSQKEQKGNWLPMNRDTNSINVRQTFQDRSSEIPAEITIERIGAESDRPRPLTPEKLDRGLMGAVGFLRGTTQIMEDWAESFLPHINELPPADQAYCQKIGGDPNIFYFHSAWQLEDDEVMVIEADTIPECQTWNFQLDNWWMESLDYRYHQIHINKHTAHYNDDGGVRLVVAHSDPGVPNWIETAGHNIGTMCWRWIGAKEHPPVSCTVMKRSELG